MGVGEKNPWLFLANTSEKCGTRDFPYSGWIQSKTHGFTSSVSNIKTIAFSLFQFLRRQKDKRQIIEKEWGGHEGKTKAAQLDCQSQRKGRTVHI
ncbi:hypothetical protein P8452_77721 [Trifolium repens]|jgi:hypothetical protein|nr:hypothetical protein QL285_095843 [Trifolium repens]WJX96525.1 hypothetical protein P8452_77721 [Trifolium repens]